MRITNRDDVRPGDRVTWGALGYLHEGVACIDPELWDGEISVNGGVDWHSNFKWAERDERSSMHRQAPLRDKGTGMELNPEAAPRLIPIPPPYDAANDPRFRDDGTFYLLRYRGRWYAGTAQKLWYGWNFNAVYDAGVQLSYGKFDAIYEIEGRATRPEPILEILSAACVAEGAGECD